MAKRRPALLSIITTEGIPYDIPAKTVESLRWDAIGFDAIVEQKHGPHSEYLKVTSMKAIERATLTATNGATYEVTMDRVQYNALVADWALSAPGRTRGLQFAIRAQARAGRLTGNETWPRNKT